MNWFQKNFKTIIYTAFLIPILAVAVVSISHVTKWYGLSNPVSWAIYLSIGIEIAALSALAAIAPSRGQLQDLHCSGGQMRLAAGQHPQPLLAVSISFFFDLRSMVMANDTHKRIDDDSNTIV